MEEAAARMFMPSGETVCRRHVEDDFIRSTLQDIDDSDECALCSAAGEAQVDLDELRDLVVSVLRTYRRRAIDELFHDRETETGYAFPDHHMEDTADAVYALFEDAFDDDLREAVIVSLDPDYWFRPGLLWLEGAELYLYSWCGFRDLTRAGAVELDQLLTGDFDPHDQLHPSADGLLPSQVLPEVLALISDLGVVRSIETTESWLRVVHVPIGEPVTAARIGTAPADRSTENRMNRAGEPMFYGAEDPDTALAEVGAPERGDRAVLGEWTVSRPLRVLELVDMGAAPDLYDVDRAGLRWRHLFLADFASDVSRVVEEHALNEYRATQLLLEFLRRGVDGLDGIVYRSSITGKRCCALDISNAACVASGASVASAQLVLRRVVDGGA